MILKPTGYYVLIKMEKIEEKSTGGIILSTKEELERESSGHDIGIISAIGPTAWTGFQGCTEDTAEKRAAQWGCKIGDKVEFSRYDGKTPRYEEFKDCRIIQDAHIIGVIGE